MKDLEPHGIGRRVLSALVLLLGIAYGSHLIWLWLGPLMPVLVSTILVLCTARIIFRR